MFDQRKKIWCLFINKIIISSLCELRDVRKLHEKVKIERDRERVKESGIHKLVRICPIFPCNDKLVTKYRTCTWETFTLDNDLTRTEHVGTVTWH